MNTRQLSTQEVKAELGRAAAALVEDDMLVGLGTGSTANCFIQSLSERVREGLKVTTVASSERSHALAEELGIPVIHMEQVNHIDLTIDGADEVDPQKRLIKGGGGALLREKIVASRSSEMLVVVDNGKCVDQLGAFPVPVEIVRFGTLSTLHLIAQLGYHGVLRELHAGHPYITDEGHHIVDIHFETTLDDPESVNEQFMRIPGLVDTGFFFGLAGRILVGHMDGRIETRN